jgi:hypothetical protein
MLSLEYFLVCESFSVDAITNSVSLFLVMDELAFAEFPATIPRINIVACWRGEPPAGTTDYQAMIKITPPGPHGPEDPGYKEFPTNLVVDRRRVRVLHGVGNIPIASPGDLTVEVLLNGQHQATHVVSIARQAADGAEQTFGATGT